MADDRLSGLYQSHAMTIYLQRCMCLSMFLWDCYCLLNELLPEITDTNQTRKASAMVALEKLPEDGVILPYALVLLIHNVVMDLHTALKKSGSVVQTPHWTSLCPVFNLDFKNVAEVSDDDISKLGKMPDCETLGTGDIIHGFQSMTLLLHLFTCFLNWYCLPAKGP